MLRQVLRRIPGAKRLAATLRGMRGAQAPRASELIEKHLCHCPSPFIVQVGSNDGCSGDPLYKLFQRHKDWHGLFVEPVPHLMAQLRKNYAFSPNVRFECAVINDGLPATFYYFDAQMRRDLPDLPEWWDQLGSLNADHGVGLPGFERVAKYRRSMPIPGMTLSQLFKKHGVDHLDLFHVDAEGSDWVILSQLDLARMRPCIILYEKKCLPYADRIAAHEKLHPFYDMFSVEGDMLCIMRVPLT